MFYLLKIEAKSFRDARKVIVAIQKTIWEHLLSFKEEIISYTCSLGVIILIGLRGFMDLSIDFCRTKFPPKLRYGVQTRFPALQ